MLTPERQQVELREFHLDGRIPPDHRVRAVCAYVEGLDLRRPYGGIAAVVEPAVLRLTRRILMAFCLYATIEKIGRALLVLAD